MPKLGKTQKAVYTFICDYIESNLIPPTVREIGAAVGLKSTSTVHMHLQNLSAKGLIILNPSKQRSITLPKATAAMGIASVPLVGNVAAGQPILAEENIQEYLSIPGSFLRGRTLGEVFALNVRGNSMIEIGIHDGDMIIVDKGSQASEGDIVVARVGDETATVKRLYYEPNQKIRLQPENRSMEPILVDAKEVAIDGKVIGLIRRY